MCLLWLSVSGVNKTRIGFLLVLVALLPHAERGSASLAAIQPFCGLQLENWENQMFSHVKAHYMLFGGLRGSRGMWSVNDLHEKSEKSTFLRTGYVFSFECRCTCHKDHEKITSCWKNPERSSATFPTEVFCTAVRGTHHESLLFACKVLTSCSIQRIRHANKALEVVFAPAHLNNKKEPERRDISILWHFLPFLSSSNPFFLFSD